MGRQLKKEPEDNLYSLYAQNIKCLYSTIYLKKQFKKFSKYLFNPFVTKKALMNLLSETALPCY
jgi:hypothetical protein